MFRQPIALVPEFLYVLSGLNATGNCWAGGLSRPRHGIIGVDKPGSLPLNANAAMAFAAPVMLVLLVIGADELLARLVVERLVDVGVPAGVGHGLHVHTSWGMRAIWRSTQSSEPAAAWSGKPKRSGGARPSSSQP